MTIDKIRNAKSACSSKKVEIKGGEDLGVLRPEELLDVVLHETVQSLPTERLRQLLGAHRLVMELQVQVVERHKRLGIFQNAKRAAGWAQTCSSWKTL